jgi:hypothetical protein
MIEKTPTTWKKVLVSSAVFGLSFALTLVLLFLGYLWYQSHPKFPPPWNIDAITATYDRVDTEGDENTIVIYYTLENKTEFDYTIEKEQGLIVLAKLQQEGSLTGTKRDDKLLQLDYPVFIPSKQRFRLAVHLKYSYDLKEKTNSTIEERRKYRKGLEEYINNEMSNLDGFVLFDEQKRFEITLPKGWSESLAESLLPVKLKGKFGYIDKTGKIIIKAQYDDAEPFAEGLATVRIGDKYGFISSDGDLIIQPTFDFASSFSEGLALVNFGGEPILGKLTTPKPSNTKRRSLFSGGKFGYIDHSGKILIPCEFEDADDFSEGLARVEMTSKWGFINKQGHFVVKPEFDLVFNYSDGVATVENGDKVGYVDKMGKFLWEPVNK